MTGFLLLIFSIAVLIASRDLVYDVEYSPGAGFFPLWLGVALLILSVVLILKSTVLKHEMTEENPFPARAAVTRIILIMGSLLVSIMLFETLGFLITMFFLVAFLLIVLEKYRWYAGALISAAMVASIYGIFKISLNVNLPVGLFP